MSGVTFFTPISYGTQSKSFYKSILEATDHYFYLGGKKAFVIAGRVENEKQAVILSNGNSSFLVSALKVATYFTIIIPVIVLVVKAILRHTHHFHLIDPKAELEKDIVVESDIIRNIQQLFLIIQQKGDNPQIEWLSKYRTSVFRLTTAPHLVFKMSTSQNSRVFGNNRMMDGEEQIRNRFENMIKAKEVCLAHQLESLVLPQARLLNIEVDGDNHSIIAEKSMNIRATESAQEELYHNHVNSLGSAVHQLGTFIVETGFSDVTWRNIPVIDEVAKPQDPCRIALIDLEHMEGEKRGIFGDGINGSCGLVRCLFSKEQIDAVLADAKKRGIVTDQEAQDIKAKRMGEISLNEKLIDFYRRNKILENHRKPLVVNLDTLKLDLNAMTRMMLPRSVNDNGQIEYDSQLITMKQVVNETVAEINRLIQAAKEGESVKGKRYVLLNVSENNAFTQYDQLGREGENNTSWLNQIINALIEKGHLFRLVKVNGYGYFIQA